MVDACLGIATDFDNRCVTKAYCNCKLLPTLACPCTYDVRDRGRLCNWSLLVNRLTSLVKTECRFCMLHLYPLKSCWKTMIKSNVSRMQLLYSPPFAGAHERWTLNSLQLYFKFQTFDGCYNSQPSLLLFAKNKKTMIYIRSAPLTDTVS